MRTQTDASDRTAVASNTDEASTVLPEAPTPTPTPTPTPGQAFDQALWASVARATGGLSPVAFSTAFYGWASQWMLSPGRQMELWTDLVTRLAKASVPEDADPARQTPELPAPVEGALRQARRAHGVVVDWCEEAIAATPGVADEERSRVAFLARQVLEASHPDNTLATNAMALERALSTRGASVAQGWAAYWKDAASALSAAEDAGVASAKARVGADLAATPGKVVYRNRLIEVIHYAPTTRDVYREPVLITPAWIMKYYVLDLTPASSLIQYLVDSGYSVFVISWLNPQGHDRDLCFDDYRRLGVLAALDVIGDAHPGARVHGLGYCLGGTLLSVTAAGLARQNDDRLASVTLLAAQVDFRDAGGLRLFIDEAQLAMLEGAMAREGYLSGGAMAAAFQMLNARELIWGRVRRAYLMGEAPQHIDLMVWNADVTRMPARMHAEYLRRFYLDNDFVQGRLKVDGSPVAISDIRAPLFVLGTTKDHVAPWRSVFKIHLFADTEVTFALTNGGHNAGVVSPPDHPRRRHSILTKADAEHYLDPDQWLERAEQRPGSWWPSWRAWLETRSSGLVRARTPRHAAVPGNTLDADAALPDAPGTYVRMY